MPFVQISVKRVRLVSTGSSREPTYKVNRAIDVAPAVELHSLLIIVSYITFILGVVWARTTLASKVSW
jgi:hypothetical protein